MQYLLNEEEYKIYLRGVEILREQSDWFATLNPIQCPCGESISDFMVLRMSTEMVNDWINTHFPHRNMCADGQCSFE